MDARTGLGRFREFRISKLYQLMMNLIDYCRDHGIEQILESPDVKERAVLYMAHESDFKEQLHRCSTVHGNLVILDLRNEATIYAGNRFMIYALNPGCRGRGQVSHYSNATSSTTQMSPNERPML